MTPNALLIAARNAGLALKVEAGILRVRGPQSALATWAPRLKAHKPALIALLDPPPRQPNPAPPPSPPPCETWEERAAILEFDGGLTRAEAEEQATARRWLIQEPDGWRDATFAPVASRAELRGWYPAALALVPSDDGAAPWGGAEDPGEGEPGPPQEEEDPAAAFYRHLFAGMEGPRAYVTLGQAEIHAAVVAGMVRPEEARGCVLLAIKSPQGYALLTVPLDRWDPFAVLAACDPVTLH